MLALCTNYFPDAGKMDHFVDVTKMVMKIEKRNFANARFFFNTQRKEPV